MPPINEMVVVVRAEGVESFTETSGMTWAVGRMALYEGPI